MLNKDELKFGIVGTLIVILIVIGLVFYISDKDFTPAPAPAPKIQAPAKISEGDWCIILKDIESGEERAFKINIEKYH